MDNHKHKPTCICGMEDPKGGDKRYCPVHKRAITISSSVGRVFGHVVVSGKTTYSEIQLVSEEEAQVLNRKIRPGRGSSIGGG